MADSRKVKVVALSLGQGLATAISLVAMMIMARVLIKEDLAAYRQTLLAYMFFVPFLELGLNKAIYYFLPSEKVRIRGRVVDALVILGAMGVAYAVFIAFGGNQLLAKRFSNPQVAQLLLWTIPYTIITLPASLVASVLVAQEFAKKAAVFGVIRQLTIGVSTLLPLIFWQNAEAPLVGNVVASILMAFAAIVVMMKATPSGSARPSANSMKEMLKISLPLGMATMLGTVSLQLDKVIVSLMTTPEEFAVYALGAIEIPFIGMVTGSITVVMMAEMRKAVVDRRESEAVRLFRLTAEKSSFIILPMMLFLLVSADSFIQTLYTSEYADSAIPFRIYLLRLPVRIVVFGSLLLALGKTRFILTQTSIALALNCLWCFLLVKKFGPYGAAAGSTINAYFVMAALNLWFLGRTLNCSPWSLLPFRRLFVTILQFVPIMVVIYFTDVIGIDWPPGLRFSLNAFVFSCFYLYWANGKIYSYQNFIAAASRIIGGKRKR